MMFKVFGLIFVLNAVWCRSLSEESEATSYTPGNAPFFELPCMVGGGTCAKSLACPLGTSVQIKGLCPVQQALGIECCTLTKVSCRSKGGECISSFLCPRILKLEDATDCVKQQCCSFLHGYR